MQKGLPLALAPLAVGTMLALCSSHPSAPGEAAGGTSAEAAGPLSKGPIPDPSFEHPKERDRFGLVFEHWDGWTYESDARFEVSSIAHTGRSSILLVGGDDPKIRIFKKLEDLPPGRYRMRAFIRGLDIRPHRYGRAVEFAFDGRYMPLEKHGTFGWTPVTFVTDVTDEKDVRTGPSIGLFSPGRLWVDDVTLERVSKDVDVTAGPVVGAELAPIAPPKIIGKDFARCPVCGYKNLPKSKTCYACGARLGTKAAPSSRPAFRTLTSFEDDNPASGGSVSREHASHGGRSLRISRGYARFDGNQDWSGYDFLEMDAFAETKEPLPILIEIHDAQSDGYWTRVNIRTMVPPGRSSIALPIDRLFVGEKSRPGRSLDARNIRKVVISIDDKARGALYIDNLRLERAVEIAARQFDGLMAFDFGTSSSPVMPGFIPIDPSVVYSPGRGYGLRDAKIWRTFDALQPDPLYQDFICIEDGGLSVDVPDGSYEVFINLDSPSEYWGTFQKYRRREVFAEGAAVVSDSMDFRAFKGRYFRFWDKEARPEEDTFETYQEPYFEERRFSVKVEDGRLDLTIQGENFAASVSTVILYPSSRAEEGRAFLEAVRALQKRYFEMSFKKILRAPSNPPPSRAIPKGYLVFSRSPSADVYYNDAPLPEEIGAPSLGETYGGDFEPLTVSVYPVRDLGRGEVSVNDLKNERGETLGAENISVGYVSYRLRRKTMDGSVYAVEPRLIVPRSGVDVPAGATRRFWLTAHVPEGTPPGLYKGTVTFNFEDAPGSGHPIALRVHHGALDPLDVPAGPWGHTIDIPWFEDDEQTLLWNKALSEISLATLKSSGFTSFSGMPSVRLLGWKDGRPVLDFERADKQMKTAREAGFEMPVVNYNRLGGFDLYAIDEAALRASGLRSYPRLVRRLFEEIHAHGAKKDWLEVYWNLGDEPLGSALEKSIENARAYREAFGKTRPIRFTIATSYTSGGPFSDDEHFELARLVDLANLAAHDEKAVRRLRKKDVDWGFYNGGTRWTFGVYMYRAAKRFGMKMRLDWHWNISAGDPFYPLDCREDDYAWAQSTPEGELMPSVRFERELREGIEDYRMLLTLERLGREHRDARAQKLVNSIVDRFELDPSSRKTDRDPSEWARLRAALTAELNRLLVAR